MRNENSTKNCTPTESARSVPDENNDVTVEHVKQIAVTSTKNCTPTESARSVPDENNDVTVEHVKQIAVNIQANIAQFSKMMKKLGDIENKEAEKYTRVFSDSHHNKKAKDKRSKTNLANYKAQIAQKGPTTKPIKHQNRGKQKTYKKSLKQRTCK